MKTRYIQTQQLGPQLRQFKETFSGFELLRETWGGTREGVRD